MFLCNMFSTVATQVTPVVTVHTLIWPQVAMSVHNPHVCFDVEFSGSHKGTVVTLDSDLAVLPFDVVTQSASSTKVIITVGTFEWLLFSVCVHMFIKACPMHHTEATDFACKEGTPSGVWDFMHVELMTCAEKKNFKSISMLKQWLKLLLQIK